MFPFPSGNNTQEYKIFTKTIIMTEAQTWALRNTLHWPPLILPKKIAKITKEKFQNRISQFLAIKLWTFLGGPAVLSYVSTLLLTTIFTLTGVKKGMDPREFKNNGLG